MVLESEEDNLYENLECVRPLNAFARIADHFRGHASHDGIVGHILCHYRACSDDRAFTNLNLLSHHRADSDMRAWPNVDAARESRAGRDVRVIANHAIMFDNRSGVNDYVVADHGVCVDDRARHYRWSNPDLRRHRNNSRRMYRRHDLKSSADDLLIKLPSRLCVADSPDADERVLNPTLFQLSH